jgi:membrane protein required for colicin V production
MLIGFARGFMKEFISLVTWVAACVLATMFASELAASFSGGTAQVANAMGNGAVATQSVSIVALAISFLVIFIGTMIVGALVNYFLSGAVSVSGLGFINRLLGGIFGLARGYIITVVLIFITQLTPVANQPAWTQSEIVTAMQPAATWFGEQVQPGLAILEQKAQSAMQSVSSL